MQTANQKPSVLAHPAFTPIMLAMAFISVTAGTLMLISYRQTAQSQPAANTTSVIEVYITGAVNKPGVYKLNAPARVIDALQAAGGFTANADTSGLNLAQPLSDGEQITAPILGQQNQAISMATTAPNTGLVVNINTADEKTLQKELRLTKKDATEIINYRNLHGPYHAISDLLNIPLSKRVYDRIQSMITVSS